MQVGGAACRALPQLSVSRVVDSSSATKPIEFFRDFGYRRSTYPSLLLRRGGFAGEFRLVSRVSSFFVLGHDKRETVLFSVRD